MFSSVIFTFLCTSVFSDILVLKAGDTLICDHYREVLDIEQRLYFAMETLSIPKRYVPE